MADEAISVLAALTALAEDDEFVVVDTDQVETKRITVPHVRQALMAFPAGAVPSADANTLDDYEEGTYVPTVVCHTSGSYTTSTNTTLAYTKIGRSVHIQGRLDVTSETSPVGQLRILLPLTSVGLAEQADYSLGSAILSAHGGSIPNGVVACIPNDALYFDLLNIADDGTQSTIDKDDVDAVFNIQVGITYLSA